MSHRHHRFFSCFILALVALLGASCSRQAGKDRALAQADAYYTSGAYDKAEIEYLNTLKIDPENARAIAQLGLIYAEQGRVGNSVAYLRKARQLQPENLEVRTKLAEFYLAARKTAEARAEANYILAQQPNNSEAPLLLAECAQSPQDIAEISEILKKLSSARSAPVLAALASLEYRQHKIPEAEALLQQALQLDPESPTINASLGSVYLARKNLPSAEAAFAKAWKNFPARSSKKLSYVQFKLQTGDVEGAKHLLLELTTQAPDTLPPLVLLAELYAKEKKYDEAMALNERVLARDPYHYPAMMLHARLRLAKGETGKALSELEKLKKIQPKNPEILHQFALTYVAQGDIANALTSLNQAVELAPDYPEAILLLADLQLRKADAKAALSALKPLVARHPDLLPAKFLLARALVGQGALDDALAVFQEVATASPKDASLLLPIALIYRQQKKNDEARKVLTQILEIEPDTVPAIEQLVDLDLSSGDFKSARQRAEALQTRQPEKAGAYLLFAKIHLMEKNLPQAETALLKAIELQPDAFAAYYLLAGIYSQTDQDKKALDQLEAVVRQSQANVPLLMRIALLQEKLKNYPAARDTYEKILALKPDFVAALNNLAFLLAEKFNDLNRSQTLAQKARELTPFEPTVADTLGWVLFKEGHYQQAQTLLSESAAKLANDPVVQHHLGQAYYMMGEAEPARSALQRALQLNPELPEKDLIKQRLAILGADDIASEPARRTMLEKALAENKNDPMALTFLGAMLEKSGELDQAQRSLQAALAINPHNVNAALVMVRVHMARHETSQALELAQATRKQAPNDPTVGHQLGRLAFQLGEYQWAASLLQESAGKLPDNLEVQFDSAKAAYSVGRVSDAEETMRHIRQTQPLFANMAEISQYLEMFALANQPVPDGQVKIDQVLKTNPSFVPALMAQGANAEKQSNVAAAQQAYQKALAQYPDFTPAKRNLALLAAAADASDPKAYELAVQAREAFSADPEVAGALGILTYRKGDFSRAADLLKESIARLGEDARRTFYLGMARYRLKDQAARASLQRALELGLKGDAAAEARKIIAELK